MAVVVRAMLAEEVEGAVILVSEAMLAGAGKVARVVEVGMVAKRVADRRTVSPPAGTCSATPEGGGLG